MGLFGKFVGQLRAVVVNLIHHISLIHFAKFKYFEFKKFLFIFNQGVIFKKKSGLQNFSKKMFNNIFINILVNSMSW